MIPTSTHRCRVVDVVTDGRHLSNLCPDPNLKERGEWKNGEHHGQGTYTSDGTNPKFPYVTRYIGEWRSGEKNGIGGWLNYDHGG